MTNKEPKPDEGLLLTDEKTREIVRKWFIPELEEEARDCAYHIQGALLSQILAKAQAYYEAECEKRVREERETIGNFLEESKETFYVVYRDSEGELTYTMAKHALDKIIKTLKSGQALQGRGEG